MYMVKENNTQQYIINMYMYKYTYTCLNTHTYMHLYKFRITLKLGCLCVSFSHSPVTQPAELPGFPCTAHGRPSVRRR